MPLWKPGEGAANRDKSENLPVNNSFAACGEQVMSVIILLPQLLLPGFISMIDDRKMKPDYLKLFPAIIVFLITLSPVSSQGIRDSVFIVPPVKVTVEQKFTKQEAGMKESGIDSLVLLEKINLSLSELLSENTPVFIKSHGRGALATVSFRGTAPSHTQVQWNGININSPMAGMVDFSLIPVYIIDEINLKHGTASVADRAGGLGGSISIRNKPDWENKFSGKYLQGIGSYNSFDEFLHLNAGNRKVQSKTRIYHNYSKNNYPFINRSIGIIDTLTGKIIHPADENSNAEYTRYGWLQELYWRPTHSDFLSLKYWGQNAERTIPRATSYEGPDNSNLNKQGDLDHRLSAEWQHYNNKGVFTLRSGITSKHLDYFLKNQVVGLGFIPVIYSESKQSAFLNNVSYTRNNEEGLSFKTSIDINYFDVISSDSVKNTGYEKDRLEISSFLSTERQFGDILNIKLMLRQDIIDYEYIPPVPYIGFDLLLLKEKQLILKGNIAGNYHHPGLNDLYWEPGGNPDLLPEKGHSYELGIEYTGKISSHLLEAELTAYQSKINNWIIWIPGFKGYWEPSNIRKVISKGIEVNLAAGGRIGNLQYRLTGTYAYTSSKNYGDTEVWGDESYGKQLVYVPLHSGNLFAKLIFRGYSVSWQHNSYSERYTTSSNDISQRDWLYPYFMNNLALGKEFNTGKLILSGELKVNNILNETYHSVLYRPMPGRNYMLILMIKF